MDVTPVALGILLLRGTTSALTILSRLKIVFTIPVYGYF